MKSLYIKNFKNISELTINQLAKVNLIVGKNSVGKSSLLEAISIYAANGNDGWIQQLLNNRGEGIVHLSNNEQGDNNEKHYLSFFSGRKEQHSRDFFIAIGESPDEALRINQVFISEERVTDERGISRISHFKPIFEDELADEENLSGIWGKGLMLQTEGKQVLIPFNRIRAYANLNYKMRFQYVCTDDFNRKKNCQLFDNVALSPEESHIIQALQIINPRIRKINFLNDENLRGLLERVPIVLLEGDDTKYRLSSMGDGINRILTIILAMLNSKDGMLFIDEFETGLHYSVQNELWRIIFMLAEKLNVQVFATSHSNDCINSFVKNNTLEQGMLIRLEKRQDALIAVNYTDNEELIFATNHNIEIR